MGAALIFLLILLPGLVFLLLLFLVSAFGAGLMPFILGQDRLRPPWWDWGMDKPAAQTEKPTVIPVAEIAAMETAAPLSAEPELASSPKTKPALPKPRW